MRWRGLSEETVAGCIMGPTLVEPAPGGRLHSWIQVGNRFLRVTSVDELDAVWVITAVLKERQSEGWTR